MEKQKKIRKHFYISQDSNIKLKQVCEISGETESTVLRLGLDKGIEIIKKKIKNERNTNV